MEKGNPEERAKELLSKIKSEFAKRMTTIAVGNTDTDISLVGTGEQRMRQEVILELNDNEIVATPNANQHAEDDIVNEAKKRNLNVTEIGASWSVNFMLNSMKTIPTAFIAAEWRNLCR